MTDAQERTEQATPKRMKEVRAKGQLSTSQDLTAWLGVAGVAVLLPALAEGTADATTDQLMTVGIVAESPEAARALGALLDGLGSLGALIGPILLIMVVSIVAGAALQGGIHFRRFSGRYEQFNLISGVRRILGTQALWEGVKAIAKTMVVGLVLVMVVEGLAPTLLTAGGLSVSALLAAAGEGVASLLQAAIVAGIALAAIDVLVVMRRNRRRTRMSKREVKDENKNSDGDPLIKSQRRSRQLAMSRNRMIAAVASADVVLVNPTHVAVALRYEPGKSAPRVVAKGAGEVATRIRERAENARVPLVRDIPLARALHAACEVGQEIPVELYSAVARVLAFVMSLKARGAARGTHTMAAPVPSLGGAS